MRKSAIFLALATCSLGLSGCQGFTAGETVSEPEPAQVRASQVPKRTANQHGVPQGKAARGAQDHAGHGQGGHDHDGHDHAGHGHDGHDHADHGQQRKAAQDEKVSASHILIRYAGSLRGTPDITRTKEQAEALALQIAKKAKAGADFATLANTSTEDPSGKGTGGKLPPFGRGAMVPAFDQAVFSMAPGEVSAPVETPFGFHVIYREK